MAIKFEDLNHPFGLPEKPANKTSALRKAGDVAVGIGSGAVGATKALTDAFGADNAASKALGGVNQGLQGLLSPETVARQYQQSRIMDEAKGQDIGGQVASGFKSLAVDPLQTVATGLGSVAPFVAAQFIPGIGQSATAARVAQIGMGAGMGAGTAKGAIFDEVKKRELATGKTEEQAKAAADAAQAYGGVNTDQIALGAGLGVADAALGATPAAVSALRRSLGKEAIQGLGKPTTDGIIKAGLKGAAGEMPVEFAQGAQEQVAANIAAQRAGYEAGTWDGAAAQGTLEGLAAAGTGAGFGILNRAKPAEQQPAATPAQPPVQSGPVVPGAPVAPATPAFGQSLTGTPMADLMGGGGLTGGANPLQAGLSTLTSNNQMYPGINTEPSGYTVDQETGSIIPAEPVGVRQMAAPVAQPQSRDVLPPFVPEFGTEPGAAPTRFGNEIDMPRPEFDTSGLRIEYPRPVITPAQRMGINPASGPLSAAATVAVNNAGGGLSVVSNLTPVTPIGEQKAIGTQRRIADNAPIDVEARFVPDPSLPGQPGATPVAPAAQPAQRQGALSAAAAPAMLPAPKAGLGVVTPPAPQPPQGTPNGTQAAQAQQTAPQRQEAPAGAVSAGGQVEAKPTPTTPPLPNQQTASQTDDKQARAAGSIATSTLDTAGKLRFADWADQHSGKSVNEVQLALVRSEFGPNLAINEVKQVAESVSRAGSVVAEQARINAKPAKQKSDRELLDGAIKLNRMRVDIAKQAVAEARDVDQFGLPIQNGPKKKSAQERLKKAEEELAALEAKASTNQQASPAPEAGPTNQGATNGKRQETLLNAVPPTGARTVNAAPVAEAQANGMNPRAPKENKAITETPSSEKEPWQMTSFEFGRQSKGNPHWTQSYAGKDDGAYLADVEATHKKVVRQAVDAGYDVPSDVLQDSGIKPASKAENLAKIKQANQAGKKDAAPAQPPAPTTEPFAHAGLKIRNSRVKVGDDVQNRWVVQSPENAEREARGERQIGGDLIVETRDEAIAKAEQEAKRYVKDKESKAEIAAKEAAEKEAAEAKKQENRGKSIVQRRIDAALDKPSTVGNGSKREAIESAVRNGYAIVEKMVDDTAAKKRDREAVDRAGRAGYMLGLSNENIPGVKAAMEAQARLKANKYEKPEYRIYSDSREDGPFREISKIEYDYAKKFAEQLASMPEPVATPPKVADQAKASAAQLKNLIQVSADSIKKLRKSDVYRVISDAPESLRSSLVAHIKEKRPDLADEVDSVLDDIKEEINPAPAKATHQDPGEKPEPVTPAVVAESLKSAARKEDVKPGDMKTWLLDKIDQALKQTTDYDDYQVWVKQVGEKEAEKLWTGNGQFGKGEPLNRLTFDVPGDGTFKVRNSVRGLLEFRRSVEQSKGFSNVKARPVNTDLDGARKGSGGNANAILNMIVEGDFEAARDYAEAVGVSLDTVKPPKGDRAIQWAEFRKNGTLPPPPDTKPRPAPKTAAQLNEEARAADEDEVDYKGFKRISTGNGSFELRDGNLTVSVTPTGRDKFQASFRGARSSPHLQGEQGAVDWAATYRNEAGGAQVNQKDDDGLYTPQQIGSAIKLAESAIRGKQWSAATDGMHKGRLKNRLVDIGMDNKQAQAVVDEAVRIHPYSTSGGILFLSARDVQTAARNLGLIRQEDNGQDAEPASPTLQSSMEAGGWAGETGRNDTIWTKRVGNERYTAILNPANGTMEVTALTDGVDTQIASFKVGDVVKAADLANKAIADDLVEQQTPATAAMLQREKFAAQVAGMGFIQTANDPSRFRWKSADTAPYTSVSVRHAGLNTFFVTRGGELVAPLGVNALPSIDVGKYSDLDKTIEVLQAEIDRAGRKQVADPSPTPAPASTAGFSDLEKSLQAKSHATELSGDVGIVAGGGVVRYVSLEDAAAAAQQAIESGVRPVAFQILDATGIRIGDVDRVLGQLDKKVLAAGRAQVAAPAPAKLTQAEAKELMQWEDLGQKDGVKTHILTFYESKADKAALRGRMTVATVTKGDRSDKNWMVDGIDQKFGVLGMAKNKAMEVGMAKAVADGFVESGTTTPMAKYDDEAKLYGYTVDASGAISKDGKKLSPVVREAKGRLRVESPDGRLLFSGAQTGGAFGEFLKSFWKAEKVAAGSAPVAQDAKPGNQKPESTQPKPASKIEDFGEKIAGAKKDLWTGFSSDLGAVADDDIANQPLSKIWPAPDYQALIDGGADPAVVAFVRAARDEVPSKPRVGYKVKSWASKVKILRGLAVDLMDGKVSMKEVESMLENSRTLSRSIQGFMGRIDLYQAVGHEQSLEGFRMEWQHFSLYKGEKDVSMWVVEKPGIPMGGGTYVMRHVATGKTKEEAIAAFRKVYEKMDSDQEAKKGVQFDISSYRGENGYWITKKLGRNTVKVHGPLATVKEARDYRDQNQAALVDKLEKIKEIPNERRDVNEPRVGEDMRGGADVTPAMFGDTFGFKGVQFGNWVEQGRRQEDLNNAFDALMDMAAVLGIPTKAISLNGQLGLAFGARGSGGKRPAAAHYESDKVVINLTKVSGAGSLGHEWWHAVDNYFAKMRKGRGGEFMTTALDVSLAARDSGFNPYEGVRLEMIKAFGNVVKAINLTGMKKRAAVLDGKRSKDYWTTGEEMSARSFEAYLVSKLQDQNASNDYLANIVDEAVWDAAAALGLETENSYPYPTAKEVPSIRAAFDQFFQTVQTKKDDDGNVAMFSRQDAPASPRTPASTIRAAIEKAYGNLLSKLEAKGLVVIAQTEREAIEAAAQARADKTGGDVDAIASRMMSLAGVDVKYSSNGNIEGFFDKQTGKSFLVADNLTAASAPGTLMHEVGIHMAANGKMAELFKRAGSILKTGTQNAFIQRVKDRMARAGETSDEEAAAYITTEYERDRTNAPVTVGKWIADLTAAVRAWLFRNGIVLKAEQLTIADIAAVARANARSMARGGPNGGPGGGQSFSRSDMPATIEVDGKTRSTMNSNGQPIHPTLDGVRNFWKWFGDSKVVDEQGRPLVVYHGTRFAGFSVFMRSAGGFVYTTPNPDYAASFSGSSDGSAVYPVFVKTKNPLDMRELGESQQTADGMKEYLASKGVNIDAVERWDGGPIDQIKLYGDGPAWRLIREDGMAAALEKAGYDGVILNEGDGQEAYLTIRPTQIKSSTGNNGAFSAADPDIRFSRAADMAGNAIDKAKQTADKAMGKDFPRAASMPDLNDDQRSLLGKVGASQSPASDAIKAATDRAGLKIRQGMVDRFAALKELDEKALGQNFIADSITNSAWVLAKMSSAGAGALNAMMKAGRIEMDAQQKVIGLKGAPNGGLTASLQKLGGPAEVERFFAWMAANRAEKLMVEGRENLFTPAEIAAGKTLNTGTTEVGKVRPALYSQVHAEFQQYRDDVLAIAEQTGIINSDNRAMWRDEFYVPFYRVMEDDADRGRSGGNGLSRQEAYKKLKGGKQNLNDLMENTLMNFHHLLSASLKNQAAVQAIKNAEAVGIARKVPEARRDTKTSTFVLVDGNKVFYEVDDPLVFESITTLADPGLNNTAVRVMGAFKRLFTNMTTATPQFIIANTFRDLLQASATSPTSKNIAKNLKEGIQSYRDEKTRAEMLASGGAFSFGHIYGMHADEVKESLQKTVAGAGLISSPSMIPSILRKGWDAWGDITDLSENASRAATYTQNVDELGKLRASFEARDVMDFSQHGAWPAVRLLVRIVPFLNARLQGLDKLYRSGLKPSILTAMGKGTDTDKQAAARFAMVTGALTLATMALYMMNADDDEYKKLEEWQKDTYWFIRVGENAFFLPKPFEVGAIATMAERTLQQAMDDKATGKLFRERMWDMLMHTFAFNPTPQMFQPLIDVYSNKDAFTGRDIETAGMERMSTGLRSRDSTTAPATALSAVSRVFGDESAIAVSPVQADHLIKGYLGGVGATAAGWIDTMYRAATGQSSPDKAWSEYQPIRRFYRDLDVPVANTRYTTLFYDGLKEANRVYADVMELQKLGRPEDAQALATEKRSVLQMRIALNAQQRRLTEINNRMKEVRRSDKDGEWKRRELDLLNTQKAMITERMGKRIEDARVGA